MPTAAADPEERTARLDLHRPSPDDAAQVHAILSDPAVWTHHPSLRVTDPAQTARLLRTWLDAWDRDGLGSWVARLRGGSDVIGFGGCGLVGGLVWNLGYRLTPSVQGRGLATELAHLARERAHGIRPDAPVVAYMVEHNRASAAVAERVGLALVHRAPDAGNPDPGVMRLIHADRELSASELAVALR